MPVSTLWFEVPFIMMMMEDYPMCYCINLIKYIFNVLSKNKKQIYHRGGQRSWWDCSGQTSFLVHAVCPVVLPLKQISAKALLLFIHGGI